jgi:hypothetical protein
VEVFYRIRLLLHPSSTTYLWLADLMGKWEADDIQKKRKTTVASQEEIKFMRKLYDSVNAQKSGAGEDLNQYFIKPVDKNVSHFNPFILL